MESSHLVIFSTSGKFITKFNVLRCISLSETLFWTRARGRIPITLRFELLQLHNTSFMSKRKLLTILYLIFIVFRFYQSYYLSVARQGTDEGRFICFIFRPKHLFFRFLIKFFSRVYQLEFFRVLYSLSFLLVHNYYLRKTL